MLSVRPLSEHDVDAAMRLSTQAGWNQIEADWRRLISLWPQACLGGWIDNSLVATGTLAIFGEVIGWIGMILVEEGHRGKGYGGAMFDSLLELASNQGICRLGLDATDLGRPVYLKRGFVDVGTIDRWILKLSSHDLTSRVLLLGAKGEETSVSLGVSDHITPAHWPGIAELDQAATGVDRTALLERIASEPNALVCVAIERDRVQGFAFYRRGYHADMIGPIVARSSRIACRLVHDMLAQHDASRDVFIDVFHTSGMSGALLAGGFQITRRLTRMLLPVSHGPTLTHANIYAAAGFELG